MIVVKGNMNNKISNIINECIKLLPKEYLDLDIELFVISKKIQSLKYIYLREFIFNLKDIFTGCIAGSSCIYYNKIFLYTCNFNLEYEIERLRLVAGLYHEIRHQYQKQKMKTKFKKYNLNKEYNKNTIYGDRWQEKDANEFSNLIISENKNKIMELIK